MMVDLGANEDNEEGFLGKCAFCEHEGMKCKEAGVTTQTMTLNDGFWRSDTNSTKIEHCENDVTCINSTCAEGYEGPICSVCSAGYRINSKGDCNSCESFTQSMTTYVVAGVVTLAVAYLSVKEDHESVVTQRHTRGRREY